MKTFTQFITESKQLKEDTKRNIINSIYKKVDTKGIFRDHYWAGYQNILKQLEDMGYYIISEPSNVHGYRNGYSIDGKEKRWDIQIIKDNTVIGGAIRAFAAGSVKDPFDAYDLTITLW